MNRIRNRRADPRTYPCMRRALGLSPMTETPVQPIVTSRPLARRVGYGIGMALAAVMVLKGALTG